MFRLIQDFKYSVSLAKTFMRLKKNDKWSGSDHFSQLHRDVFDQFIVLEKLADEGVFFEQEPETYVNLANNSKNGQ